MTDRRSDATERDPEALDPARLELARLDLADLESADPLGLTGAPGQVRAAVTPAPAAPSAATASQARGLWRNRDFVLLWGGQAVSAVGNEISSLALPLLVLALTGSAARAGLVGAAGAVARLLGTLPAGALVDRVDRKRALIICDALRALNMASVAVAFALGHLGVEQLYVVAAIEGLGASFFYTARASALARVVPGDQLVAAVGQQEVAQSLVTLLGPPLGGVIFGLGRALPFLADAVSYASSVISLAFIRTRFQEERTAPPQRFGSDIAEGLRWLWRQRLVRFLAIMYGGFGLFMSGTELGVIVLARQRGATPALIGVIFAAGGAGGLLGALVAPRIQRRWRLGRVLPVLHWLYALALVGFAVAPGVLGLALVEAGFLFVDQIYDVNWDSYRLAIIPDALRGRVLGASSLLPRSIIPLGLALAGILIQRIGAGPALITLASGLALMALAVTLNPHVRHAPPLEEARAE